MNSNVSIGIAPTPRDRYNQGPYWIVILSDDLKNKMVDLGFIYAVA